MVGAQWQWRYESGERRELALATAMSVSHTYVGVTLSREDPMKSADSNLLYTG